MRKILERYEKIVVFDVETTGFNPARDEIIEFAGVVLKYEQGKFRAIEEIDTLIRYESPLPSKITTLTGITDRMLKKGIHRSKLAETLETVFTEDTLAVAYNIQFDIGFIHSLMEKEKPDFVFKAHLLDMLTIYRDNHPYPHKLSNAIESYQIEFPNSHRAIDDTRATAELFRLMHEIIDVTPYINYIGYPARYGHRGIKLPHVTYVAQESDLGSFKKTIENL